MKKTFLFFAMAIAAFALASCNEDIAIEEAVTTSGSELVFKASMGVDTKVEIGETGVVTWKAGDQIKVFALDATYNLVKYNDVVVSEVINATNISADGKTAYFISEQLGNAKLLGAKTFIAFLVDSGVGDPTVKNEVFGFPASASASAGIRSMSCAYCDVDTPNLSFQNFACLIKVKTSRTDVKAIAVQGRNGEKLARNGIIGLDFKFHDTTDESAVADGNVYAAVLNQPGIYYLALTPGVELTKGFKILLYGNSNEELDQFSYPYQFTTVANKIYNFGDFDNSYQANDKLLKKMIKDAGYNPDGYYRISYNLSYYAFFKSDDNSGKLRSAANSGQNDGTEKKFCATQVFSKDELPNGTLLVVRPDYMYRPEGWQTLGSVNSNGRPDNVKTGVVEIDDAWWSNYTYRGFNLARNDSAWDNSSLYLGWNTMSELQECFGIFVPKDKISATSVQGILKAEGKDLDDYEQKYVNVIALSFWNSGNGTILSAKNGNAMKTLAYYPAPYMIPYLTSDKIWSDTGASLKMHATEIFTKEEIPEGSIIVVKPGYQYRPDAWVTIGTSHNSRPGNVDTKVVTVDSSWWGSFNYRGFNLSEVNNSQGYFSVEGNELTRASFAIFVPKASAAAEDVK